VDVLSTLLLVFIFVLSVYVLAQFFLANALSGRDRALAELNRQLAELGELLAIEKRANTDLRGNLAELSAALQGTTSERDALAARLLVVQRQADESQTALAATRNSIIVLEGKLGLAETELSERAKRLAAAESRVSDTEGRLTSATRELAEEKELSAVARSQVDLLNRQILALRQQLARIEQALQTAEAKDRDAQAQIADLGRRLNLALAQKVEELARFRSEFFGRLREVLGDRRDVTVVGDRFVFQSEVLFASGSAELNDAGREQMAQLARAINEIGAKIPSELKWILRVDGHTDRLPIRTALFPSNWELSTARALSVTRFLIAERVPPNRLAAAGFGEFQPLDDRVDEIAYRRNRRIELKLTDR
jgi:chemotaxis protein MotB